MLGRRALGRAALLASLLAGPRTARAQKAADTLRVTWRDAVPDLDPYRNQLRAGFVLAHHIWDCLVDRDPETFQIRPLLALSWRRESATALVFTLRPGVVFHDGTPLTAQDVAYTVNVVLTEPLAVPALYTWLAGADVLDETHVRIRLREPFPAVLEYLAIVVPILPRVARERLGAEGFAQTPVGTGPYRLAVAPAPGVLILERFESYFPNGPKGRPAISRVVIRQVTESLEEFTDLLADRADWIWDFGPAEAAAIAQAPALQVLRGDSLRLGYLSMDAAGRSGPGPLTDRRVRQAICHAIDRTSIARTIGGFGTRVPDAPCYPTQFGCDAGAAVRYPYDPARAKALLLAAGHPAGFATDLISYVLPEEGAAVRTYLQAVGITANLVQLPAAEAVVRAEAGQAPLFLGTWGSYSINDVAAFLPHFFGGGPLDYARDLDLAALVLGAGRNENPDQRRRDYAQAIRLITAEALWLPMRTYATTYGISRALEFRPSSDELPRWYLSRWR